MNFDWVSRDTNGIDRSRKSNQMTDEQRKDLVLKVLKFCPYCNVVYFGCDECGSCNGNYYLPRPVKLVPIPFDAPTFSPEGK